MCFRIRHGAADALGDSGFFSHLSLSLCSSPKGVAKKGNTGCRRHRGPAACAGCGVGVKGGFVNLRREGKGSEEGAEADLCSRNLTGLI